MYHILGYNNEFLTTFRIKLLGILFLSVFTHNSYSQASYSNPVIAGFNPDPSICRVGEDYYLVTSSFEYFPGVPIYHSRDLIHWKQIGHCLTRKSQLNLDKAWPSGGIFAPTIRYHKGVFYMITTNVSGEGNFYVSAKKPEGPWSEPIWVDKEMFDPSLLFDDDGKVYYTRRGNWASGGTMQAEIELKSGKLIDSLRTISKGLKCDDQEGPHLYKINGFYYLMVAEGGTRFGHMACVARSTSPWGPFEASPFNPLLANHGQSSDYFRSTGHADLFQAHDGSWWVVFLATRHHHYEAMSHLGRETCLMPIEWQDGWPILKNYKRVVKEIHTQTLPIDTINNLPTRDNFDTKELALCWNFLRNPMEGTWSLTDRKGYLRLNGNANSTNSFASIVFVGRRQQHLKCEVSSQLDFNPGINEEAGLTVWLNYKYHYDVLIAQRNEKPCVIVRKTIGDISSESVLVDINPGIHEIAIKASPDKYEFFYLDEKGNATYLASALTQLLGTEIAGSFTGVFFAMYASGNGSLSKNPADFNWFEYTGIEK